MKTQTSDYTKQAADFLKSVGGNLKVTYSHYGKHFTEDKDYRHIFRFTLSRMRPVTVAGKSYNVRKSYTANFGQSIKAGAEYPNAYDILSCVQKYEVGTFEDFCSDFGYDNDSRTAEKTYKAVLKEFAGIERVFGDVLNELQEIQ